MTWFTWTPLELAASIMTAICVYLGGRNSVHTWWTGIIACILFGLLFFDVKLYADATLQIFFMITSAIGWYNWSKAGNIAGTNIKGPMAVTHVKSDDMWKMSGYAILSALAYAVVLHSLTDAFMPFIDSFVLTFSIMAQFLMMKRKVQTWAVWILVNTLSVPLYWSRELYMTSVLYGFFWLNAVWSLKTWIELEKNQ